MRYLRLHWLWENGVQGTIWASLQGGPFLNGDDGGDSYDGGRAVVERERMAASHAKSAATTREDLTGILGALEVIYGEVLMGLQ